ncbi:MAG: hypothetical protein AB1505_35070 [Candidatus Latescibacterota bacterium]
MDVVSHALWGGGAFGRRTRKAFLAAAGTSLLPDVLSEGLFGVLSLLHVGGMPAWEHGHPNITAFPPWAGGLYGLTHSLVVFTVAFLLVWALAGRPVWLVGAWGLHVLIDIPTHSLELFPTPFLWPLSDLRVDGVPWHQPVVFGVNALLLLGVYSLWWGRTRRSAAPRHRCGPSGNVWASVRRAPDGRGETTPPPG